MRAKWNHAHGATNVWREPAMRGSERVKSNGLKSLHMNQKSLCLIERVIAASIDPGDVVWEPFGGLRSAAVCSLRIGRPCYASEIVPEYFAAAAKRLKEESENDATAAAGIRKA